MGILTVLTMEYKWALVLAVGFYLFYIEDLLCEVSYWFLREIEICDQTFCYSYKVTKLSLTTKYKESFKLWFRGNFVSRKYPIYVVIYFLFSFFSIVWSTMSQGHQTEPADIRQSAESKWWDSKDLPEYLILEWSFMLSDWRNLGDWYLLTDCLDGSTIFRTVL